MARRRRKSSKRKTSSNQFSNEIAGLILILLGILGFGFGTVGSYIKIFALYLVGELWALVLVLLIFIGIYLLFKRELPTFFSSKLVGFYMLLLVVIVTAHHEFIKSFPPNMIIRQTMEWLKARAATITPGASLLSSGLTSIKIGGGMIGAAFAAILARLFDKIGTTIVLVICTIVSIVLMFDFSLSDLLNKTKDSLFNKEESDDDNEDEEEEDEEEEEPVKAKEPGKSILSLFGKKKDKKEVKEAEVVTPVDVANEIKEEVKEDVAPIRKTYRLPSITLLDEVPKTGKVNSNDFTKSNKIILERVLKDFDIQGTVVEIHVGPAVTQYEVAVHSGTKLSRVVAIDKEIALALAAKQVSIEAPIPGRSTVGIEIPNPSVSAVKIREVLGNVPKEQENAKILAALGKDLMGRVQTMDITKTPHLLVAGATGSGKSVCMNSIIASILMRYTPDQVKLVLVDPKKVEMSHYNGVPHLLWPVVNDAKAASVALQRVVAMMDERYDKFSETGVKKIEEYNEYVEKELQKNPDCGLQKMFYLVVIIDELADLMMVASKEVEGSIQRITQLARAAGIHLIVATQRPSTNVITGVIKANIPSRIAFAVASFVDSRTILDAGGAEKLLGKGDMLFLPMGQNTPTRIQGCFITDDETRRLIKYVCGQQSAVYDDTLNRAIEEEHDPTSGNGSGPGGTDDDPLYNEIVEFAMETGKVSASLLQRRFRLGYNRAARIVDQLEERGIIGPANGSKPREVLIGKKEE